MLSQDTARPQPLGKSAQGGGVSQLRSTCGGSGASSLTGECEEYKNKRLQKKLSIGAYNDPLERQADRIADQVLAASSAVSGAAPLIQRFTGQATDDTGAAPASVDRVLAGASRPLDTALQQDMGRRFGYDFSQVRVHTDASAQQSARDVSAHAYTVGYDIVFGAGRFAPWTHEGRRLLAHELTHVVQQSDSRFSARAAVSVQQPSDAHLSAGASRSHSALSLQRMKYGSIKADTPAPEISGTSLEEVPENERPLVDQAIRSIAAVANDRVGFARCHDFFAKECQGDKNTLAKTFDAAVLWKWPRRVPSEAGAKAETPGTNIAYMQYAYNRGLDWLTRVLMHELLHNCGGGSGGDPFHRRADVASMYCMGAGKTEITAKSVVDLEKHWNLIIAYRRLISEWLSGRLQLTVGTDIGLTGLLRLLDTSSDVTPAELGSGTLGARRRFNVWGAERYGGLVLSADLGAGLDRFKVRAPNRGDKPSAKFGPGAVLQLGARVEFWIPDIEFKEGRATALLLEAGYRLIQPLTPEARRIHGFIVGVGFSF